MMCIIYTEIVNSYLQGVQGNLQLKCERQDVHHLHRNSSCKNPLPQNRGVWA